MHGAIIMNRGKDKITDVIELASGEKITKIEEGRYKYHGILENKITEWQKKITIER